MKKLVLTLITLILLAQTNYAQVAINTNGATADASSILDISSTDKGILIPRLSTAQRIAIASPVTGLLVYDTDTDRFWYYDSQWIEIAAKNFIGINGLSDGKSDNVSVFLGTASGANDDGSNSNTSIGHYSLANNTSGFYNTATGYQALRANTSGTNNSAYGLEALEANLTGASNSAFGFQSLTSNTSGNNNIGIGYNVLFYNSTGGNNTAIGVMAGQGVSGSNISGCVFLGYEAGKNNTNSNKLYIDNSSTSAPLIGGDFSSNQVDINGTIKITGGSPGSGKVLTSDASGLASWGTAGASSLDDLSDAKSNNFSVFLGINSGENDDGGNNNTGVGYSNLQDNTSGFWNTSIGYVSLSDNTTGDHNTGLGYAANSYNKTGNDNTAVGAFAGQGTYGNSFSGCVFLGYEAGKNNTSSNKLYIDNTSTSTPLIGGDFTSNQVDINGVIKITGGIPGNGKVLTSDASGLASWETPTAYASAINDLSDAVNSGTKLFMGTNAGLNNTGNYNTGIGYESLKLNSTGTYNTALGFKTLDANTEGYGNTGLGHGSLGANTTGDYNTAIGREALDANTTGNYNTAVGFNAFPAGIYSNSTAIGYNTTISGNNQIHLGNTSIVEIKGQVSFTTYSDGRIKDNVNEDVVGLDFIVKLRPVTYNINVDRENNLLGITDESNLPEKYDIQKIKLSGFIAQEVEEAASSSDYNFSGVHKPKHEKDLYGLSYAEFVVPLVKGMQEQQQQIEILKRENSNLKARLERLEQLIDR